MRFIALIAIAALSFTSLAKAETLQLGAVATSARQIYASCLAVSQREGAANPAAACACITGYMGASMNDRDFEVASTLLRVGEMSENGASQAAIEAEVLAFINRGFTQADIDRVSAAIQEMSERGDAVCGQFDAPGSV